MNRWGSEGPPPEAYSRVTNPERFRPLHGFALTLLTQLVAAFEVGQTEGYSLDNDLKVGDLARPSVRLVPHHSKAAPVTVSFTTFPGLRVRAGRCYAESFPSCGCDACDETADVEIIRLGQMIDAVVAGRFREGIVLPPLGDAWQVWELWSPHRSSGGMTIDRKRARAMLADVERSSIAWAPWTRRPATHGERAGKEDAWSRRL